jgi:hypothetical protein
MLRRIYFSFPGREIALQAVQEFEKFRIPKRHIHTIAREGVDIAGLPESTLRQRTDAVARIEQLFWNLNLVFFFLLLGLAAVSLAVDAYGWALGFLLLMAISLFSGHYFASHIPRTHLSELQTSLRHGEILLLVDVPKWKVALVDKGIRKQLPETHCAGVSWMSELLHT